MARARYKTTTVVTKTGSIKVYASSKVSDALKDISDEMTLYQGVRLTQVLEAVYAQGRKDGANAAFEALDGRLSEAKKSIPHKNPGRPRKS
jgi:hypothetical protein